jgi:hypothetical protein
VRPTTCALTCLRTQDLHHCTTCSGEAREAAQVGIAVFSPVRIFPVVDKLVATVAAEVPY